MLFSYLFVVFYIVIMVKSPYAEEITKEDPFPIIKFETIDFSLLLNTTRYADFLYKCLMDKIPCTPAEMRYFKRFLPEMIEDNCSKCRSSLKNVLNIFMDTMRRNHPEYYEDLTDKYDPEANYFKRNNYYDKLYEGTADVTLLLENNQVLSDELSCLLNEGPCSTDGKVLHEVLSDILSDNCMKCSRRQKEAIHTDLTYLFKHHNLSQYIDANNRDSFDKLEIISKDFMNEPKVVYDFV